jgi:hypothetical protein
MYKPKTVADKKHKKAKLRAKKVKIELLKNKKKV